MGLDVSSCCCVPPNRVHPSRGSAAANRTLPRYVHSEACFVGVHPAGQPAVTTLMSAAEFTWIAMPSYLGVGRGTVISQTEQSEPFQFTKICRPTAYRASTRHGDVQKLVRLVAAAAAAAPQCHASSGRLQQSSHSAFRVLKPQQSVRA